MRVRDIRWETRRRIVVKGLCGNSCVTHLEFILKDADICYIKELNSQQLQYDFASLHLHIIYARIDLLVQVRCFFFWSINAF